MDSSLSDSSVHGILQARILAWVAILSSRGSPWPRDLTQVSCISSLADGFFCHWATGEAQMRGKGLGGRSVAPNILSWEMFHRDWAWCEGPQGKRNNLLNPNIYSSNCKKLPPLLDGIIFKSCTSHHFLLLYHFQILSQCDEKCIWNILKSNEETF